MANHTQQPSDEVDPLPLGALSGATLTWERRDGTTEVVEFDE
jgi:hypothetical protein